MTSLATVTHRYPADANPCLTYLSSLLSPRSRETMRGSLRRVVTLVLMCEPSQLPPGAETVFAWHQLRYQHVTAIKTRLMELFSPATVNRILSAVRGVLKECWRLGYIDAETYHRARDVANLRYQLVPTGRAIKPQELRALLLGCYEDGKRGIRDLAIIALLSTTGMRRAELSALDVRDFDEETGCVTIRKGKGAKQRTVYATNKTLGIMRAWLLVRGEADGALFVSIKKGDKVTGNRLPAPSVQEMVRKRSIAAGLPKTTAHDFRRSFISNMLDENVDMITVAKLTGHSDPRMLSRYDRRGERAKQDAQGKLDLPL